MLDFFTELPALMTSGHFLTEVLPLWVAFAAVVPLVVRWAK